MQKIWSLGCQQSISDSDAAAMGRYAVARRAGDVQVGACRWGVMGASVAEKRELGVIVSAQLASAPHSMRLPAKHFR